MKKILIAYDASPGADDAMTDLNRAGLPGRVEARVLSVADVWLPGEEPEQPAFPDGIPPARFEARRQAMQAFEAAKDISRKGAEKLRAAFPQWTIEPVAVADSPAWAILEASRSWPADLVVLGSHGRSLLHKFFLGSVSQKVAAETVSSVRIYRPHHGAEGGPARIVVAVDGSGDSSLAVREAASRNWPAGTLIELLTVVEPKLQSAAARESGKTVDEWFRELGARHEALFAKEGVKVQSHLLNGDPKAQILDYAARSKADCIFIGSRGLNHGNRLYLGTFASAIASRAHCSVEIIRPTPDGSR